MLRALLDTLVMLLVITAAALALVASRWPGKPPVTLARLNAVVGGICLPVTVVFAFSGRPVQAAAAFVALVSCLSAGVVTARRRAATTGR